MMVKQGNRLLSEAVKFLSSEVFKFQPDKSVSKLIWPHSWSCSEQEFKLETHSEVRFQLTDFYEFSPAF